MNWIYNEQDLHISYILIEAYSMFEGSNYTAGPTKDFC